jgi:hypothetical protein
VFGCDLDVEVQRSGGEQAVEPAAGGGFGAAEGGGEFGEWTAAVLAEFGEERDPGDVVAPGQGVGDGQRAVRDATQADEPLGVRSETPSAAAMTPNGALAWTCRA